MRSSLHLEAVEAVRQRATRPAAWSIASRSERERGGLTGVQSTRMLCMQMRSDRPIGYPVLQRPPHGSSSSRSPCSAPRPGPCTDSPRPARSIRFRKNVLYKQKQIKTLILLYVNRRGGGTKRSQAHYEAACLLSLQARTRAFFLASLLFSSLLFPTRFPSYSGFHGRLPGLACLSATYPPSRRYLYDVLLIRHLYVIEKTAIFAVGGTVQWWKAAADTDHRRQCTRLSCVKRMREDARSDAKPIHRTHTRFSFDRDQRCGT